MNRTQEKPFYDEAGKNQGKVNMMYKKGQFSYKAIVDLQSHALELPYGDEERLSMIILLPKAGTALTTVLGNLSSYGIESLLRELQLDSKDDEDVEVEVYLPRFSITSDFTLNSVLEQMGIKDIFDGRKANLSKMTRRAYVSRIVHKAQIDVNEVGTVAAAVTAAEIVDKMSPPEFMANRPFAFLIVEKQTNSLLFCGQVRNPGKVEFKTL